MQTLTTTITVQPPFRLVVPLRMRLDLEEERVLPKILRPQDWAPPAFPNALTGVISIHTIAGIL
jgi:hypothetical protein